LFVIQTISFIIFFHSFIFFAYYSRQFFIQSRPKTVKISKSMSARRINCVSQTQLVMLKKDAKSVFSSPNIIKSSTKNISSIADRQFSKKNENLKKTNVASLSKNPMKKVLASDKNRAISVVADDLNIDSLFHYGSSTERMEKKIVASSADISTYVFDTAVNDFYLPDQDELGVIQDEIVQIKGMAELSDLISVTWSPPRGVRPLQICTAEVLIGNDGCAADIFIKESSKVASYDASVRVALASIHYPAWAFSKLLSFTFGDE
jgi:hypothetical protein